MFLFLAVFSLIFSILSALRQHNNQNSKFADIALKIYQHSVNEGILTVDMNVLWYLAINPSAFSGTRYANTSKFPTCRCAMFMMTLVDSYSLL